VAVFSSAFFRNSTAIYVEPESFGANDMIQKSKQSNQPPCPPWELLLKFTVQAETMTRRQRKSVVEHSLWEEAAEALGLPKLEPKC